MPKILVIVPSRARPWNAEELLDSWSSTTEFKSDILFVVDDDDEYRFYYPQKWTEYGPRLRMCPTLNKTAVKHANDYDIIGFLGDDHRFRTPGWESMVIDAWTEGNKIIYGNDLLRGEELPTAVFMDSKIINTLGYMVPPGLIHMFADNFWLEFGTRLDAIKYLPDMQIEHMHFTVGKSANDDLYASVNNDGVMRHDANIYEAYLQEDMQKAVDLCSGCN